MYLGIAEVLSMPISIVLNAIMARYLGPEDLGHIYLASTIGGLAFLIVNWGHGGSLPAAVVLDKGSAGVLLGTSIAWRMVGSVIAYVVVGLGCHLFGFNEQQQWALGLVFLGFFFQVILSACQEAMRGFERAELVAYSRVGWQFLTTVLVIPVLVLGGRLRLTLLAQALAYVLVLIPLMRMLKPTGIGKLGWDRERFKALMVSGTPFAIFGLALMLQPNIDAFYLAKLSSSEVIGWYAVSRKLVGVLLVPATALIGALYPTLCRLFATDKEGFARTARDSFGTVSLLVVPMALGCALYPDLGVIIFGDNFEPAEDIVRYCAPYLFLVYFSMPLGCTLVAAGRQKVWTWIQLICVLNSALLDPLLIGYYQEHKNNGGIGLSVASAAVELLMVVAGLIMLPRGILDRRFAKTIALAVLSGGAMAGTAFGLRSINSFVAAPIACIAYAAALYFSGGISKQQVASLSGMVARKLKLGRSKAPAA